LKLFKSEYTVKANFFPELLCAPSHLQHTWIACQRLDSHKSHGAMKLAEKPEIKAWIRSEASALLWIDGFSEPHVAKWTTEFSVDVFMAANEARATVLYYFGELSMEGIGDVATEYLSSPRAVLHSFITQLVQQHPDLVGQHPQWFTSSIFQSTRVSMKTSWALFKKIIGVVAPEVPLYIILDNLDTIGELSSDSREFGCLVRKMSRLVSEQRQTPIKIIVSSVTNSVLNQYIRDGPAHIILRVPQTFGRSAIVQTPPHMAKKTPKRLVRLPDSDSGFGMKPSDSFDISEDEGRDSCEFLSSSSETACQASLVSRDLKTQHPTIEGQRCSGVKSKSIPRPRSGSPSDSSSLSFSDSESETRHSQNTEDKDIEFSSEESGSA